MNDTPTYTPGEVAAALAALNAAYQMYGTETTRNPGNAALLNELSSTFEQASRWFAERKIVLVPIKFGSGQGFKVKE